MRRALHRRLAWAHLGLALAGIIVLGVVAYVDSAGKSMAELEECGHPALMGDWWTTGGDSVLMIATVLF